MLASEPTKVFLTRHHLATRDSIASLAVENLLYAASVLAMVAVGLVVLLATVPLSRGMAMVDCRSAGRDGGRRAALPGG